MPKKRKSEKYSIARRNPLTKKGKPKKKTGPKTTIPKKSPKRDKQIAAFKEQRKVDPPKKIHPYARHGGRPRVFEAPAQMFNEIVAYFDWIEGEYEIRNVKVPAANEQGYITVDEEVCVRKPEPPTITGMCLYLGFSGRSALEMYKRDHVGFLDVVNYGIALVTNGYEKNLHGAKCFGSIFALTNIKAEDWKQKQEVYNDFSENVVKGFNYITPVQPATDSDPRDDSEDEIK